MRTIIMVTIFGLFHSAGNLTAQDSKAPAKKPEPKKEAAPAPNAKPGDAGGAKPDEGQPAMSTAEMQRAMTAMMPGPAHEKLGKLVGEWTTSSKMSIAGMPPEESQGTSILTTRLDGRFLHEEFTGTMMGMPMKSSKLIGHNNGSNKYEAVWVYSMGTGMMTMTGSSPDEGKTIKFTAAFDNEVGIKETMNITYTFADADHFTVSLEAGKMPDGSPGPVMETKYTRKK